MSVRKVKAKILYLPTYDRAWDDMVYAHATDTCFDVRSTIDAVIKPGERVKIPLGFKLQLEPGYGWCIRNRSGMGGKGIALANGVGTIDNGYLGEPSMVLHNLTNEEFKIERGMRVGQVVIEPVYTADFEEIESEDEFSQTARGAGGFGSTGTK
ncbi:MAG: dUTP diphosphatase [Alphaproteobacteria bacterium]|nr:dUTP diphosphatase [Alphaproteobacteria bacterium]